MPNKTIVSSKLDLNPQLNRRIVAYVTAASAAGIALLGTASPAEAKIVYTKTRVTISGGIDGVYPLDLNHDGIVDFNIGFCSCRPHGTAFVVTTTFRSGNGAMEVPGHYRSSAAALVSGANIGPKQVFNSNSGDGGFQMASVGSYLGYPYSRGSWIGKVDHYLGLRFLIDGETHYGWARMTITKGIVHAVLTGYAYETIANKPLKAGQTSDAAEDEATDAALARPAYGPSLGMLARGTEVLDAWRREEEAA